MPRRTAACAARRPRRVSNKVAPATAPRAPASVRRVMVGVGIGILLRSLWTQSSLFSRSLSPTNRVERRGPDSMSLAPGVRLGPYEILAPLGAGGMGEVYKARDKKLDRDVAVKVLPQSVAADPDTLVRFEREAKAVAALSHPNILAIHDFGTHEGISYAVMELLEGETLREKLDGGPLPQKHAVDYALQIAKGVSAAHERGVVHRDLKPE